MALPQLIVYPTKDLERAKQLFTALLGAEPYADTPYYVGYRTDGREVGLDPHGASNGPIDYWDTEDIAAKVVELTGAGWQVTSDPRDVGGGLLVAQLSDGDGSTVGLRQSPG
ncbi:MAG TPA: VOC family protein [Candidatus Binatia bacterium]|nr:VOC family protein [Candidatus Binatia bacterium]